MNNMQQLLQQAQKMQEKIAKKQKEIEQLEVTGKYGEVVSVVMTLKGQFKSITIDPSVIDPLEKEMLEDIILTAINDAKEKGECKSNEEMAETTGSMQMPKIPGLF